MKNFDYNAPNSLRQAISMLTEKNGMAKILAGGTDLIVQLRGNRFQAEHVIDVKNIPELNELSYGSKKGLTIGAAVPCYRIYNDDNCVNRYPGLIDSAAIIGGAEFRLVSNAFSNSRIKAVFGLRLMDEGYFTL